MRATAIYFSPAGGTKKAVELLQKSLQEKGIKVQLLDITGDPDIFPHKRYNVLFEKVKSHDLLIVGGPVYIDHLHYNVTDLLNALPSVGDKWGDKALLVATFGKVTPGVALAEAAAILQKSNRKTVAALNVDAEHCISRVFKKKISAGLPGAEINSLYQQVAQDVVQLLTNARELSSDLTASLQKQYEDFPHLQAEKAVLARDFPKPAIEQSKCSNCLQCVDACPVRCLQEKDSMPYVTDASLCIHCANCLVTCPTGAILMDVAHKEDFLLKKLAEQGLEPESPSRSEYFFASEME